MLDDINVLDQRDSEKTLDSSAMQYEQLTMDVEIRNPDHDQREVKNIVFAGMGGSALAPELVLTWVGDKINRPFEIVKTYQIPSYVGEDTLVFVSSCSGNTEEVLAALETAREKGAQTAIIAGGGKLVEQAETFAITHVVLPPIKIQPRMLTFVQVRALVTLLGHFGVLEAQPLLDEVAGVHDWLKDQSQGWHKDVSTDKNYAKQIALLAVGKTAIFYGGQVTKSLAYKWKISWNENAKNIAFTNQLPEFNHNEFIGWSSHPVEKPFGVFDLISNHEHDRILKRFETSDRLLSGQRPKATRVELPEGSVLQQLLWGHLLADFASIYVGILNNVDPGPVPLVTKLKEELASV
jgi:glucose/mannose-6-phosphate isomerase